MRELNPVEAYATAGGDDAMMFYLISQLPPEKQEKALGNIIIGHGTI